jgi:large subunit ribosomal protein L27
MAHKKGAGSTKNGRDSNSQRLGVKRVVKKYELEILRQRGMKFKPGSNVGCVKILLFALTDGVVKFDHKGKHKRINIVV